MIEIDIPGGKALRLATAIFDFNGTLARDGRLCDGVAERLRTLAQHLAIHVATADTTQTARAALSGFQPSERPITMRARSAAVLAKVKTFWTTFPVSRPRVFVQVRSRTSAIATSCSVERLRAYPPAR